MINIDELNSIKTGESLCCLNIDYLPNNHFKHIIINNVILEYEDFGTKEDINPKLAEPYGCGNMKFIPFDNVSDEVLNKYNITQEEAKQIQEKLDCLSFGKCGWCV